MPTQHVKGLVARVAGGPLEPGEVALPPLGAEGVEIEVSHCGVCHSDVHLVDGDWGDVFPLVPGHEVIGRVCAGTGHELGTRVGVGWHCGCCGSCEACVAGEEHLCGRSVRTCVGRPGGFAQRLRVPARFAVPIPDDITSEDAAPLLCGGLTVWSPLQRWTHPGSKVAVIGVGGLGHLAIQLAAALGCEVTAISRDESKRADAVRFGAGALLTGRLPRRAFDLILNTSPVTPDMNDQLRALRPNGVFCQLSDSRRPLAVEADRLITGNRVIAGSDTGSLSALRGLLEFATRHRITPRVVVMPMHQANAALALTRSGEARYRVVLTA